MLEGKVIVVTGASSGIGRGIAIAAARHGARGVVVGDLSPEPKEGGDTTADMVKALGAESRFVSVDVRDSAQVDALVAAAEEMGGVDCVVCNAGIAAKADGPDITMEDMDSLVAVNLKGLLLTAQAGANAMKRTGRGGSIVLISSMAGLKGTQINLGYGATKAGANLLAAALADAHGPDAIRVNAICPGFIDTSLAKESSPKVLEMMQGFIARMPLRRTGKIEEVGDVVAWLASDLSSYVTGVALPVDGGQTAVL